MMEPILTIDEHLTVRDAAKLLVSEKGDMLAVVSASGELVGVITDWDITKASATKCADDVPITEIMSWEVITAQPTDSILDVVRKLEYFEISAMPIITEEGVKGVVITSYSIHYTKLYEIMCWRLEPERVNLG